MRYLIYAAANPCGNTTGMWLGKSAGWNTNRPSNNCGWDCINEVYQRLERLCRTHNKTCGCRFDIIEVEAEV